MRTGVAMILLACAASALFLAVPGMTQTPIVPATKPSEVSFEWELEFTYKDPMCIMVKAPGEEKSKLYWYMLYRVVNRTKSDQVFIPDFTIYTNTGEVQHANRSIPTAVFDAIKQLHNVPLLKAHAAITGKILQGDDNAREGVAIWPDMDPKAGTFDVFIGGLSGEMYNAPLPVALPPAVDNTPTSGPAGLGYKPKPPASEPTTKIVLSKQLMLEFMITGDQQSRINTPVTFKRKEWVMR